MIVTFKFAIPSGNTYSCYLRSRWFDAVLVIVIDNQTSKTTLPTVDMKARDSSVYYVASLEVCNFHFLLNVY